MARLPTPGSDNGTWGTVLNDYLGQVHASDGSLKADSVPETSLTSGVRAKLNQTPPVTSVASKTGDVVLAKGDVGLGNIDNTSDANKPVSTATQTALSGKAATSHTHAATDITSGVLLPARLGSGTADGTTYLRGDGVWTTVTAAAPVSQTQTFTFYGDLTTGIGVLPMYNDSGIARTIKSVRATVSTAPTGTAVIVDVNVNGSTIFPTQSERPVIAVSGTTSGSVARGATWPVGQTLTVDVDQIGSTVAGKNLAVTVEYN